MHEGRNRRRGDRREGIGGEKIKRKMGSNSVRKEKKEEEMLREKKK